MAIWARVHTKAPRPGAVKPEAQIRQIVERYTWRANEGTGMLPNHSEIIQAIHDRHEVSVVFPSKEDQGAMLERRCAPMDYGPGRISRAQEDRYHFWDFESDSGVNHTLSLTADQIVSVEVLESVFDPATFVNWPTNWHIHRSTWGQHS